MYFLELKNKITDFNNSMMSLIADNKQLKKELVNWNMHPKKCRHMHKVKKRIKIEEEKRI